MKVTIATGLYPPEIGGPATYATMLESELPSKGFELNTVPFGWVRHYPKIIRHFVYAGKLWRASKGTDCIYALDSTSVGLPAVFVAWLRNTSFLIRLGGDYAWEQGRMRFGITDTLDEYLEKAGSAPIRVKMLAKIQTYVVGKAEKVIVPSKYLKSVVEKWGIKTDKIQVIHSALFPLVVNSSKEDLRQQFEYKFPTIVSSGRMVPWKGFDKLIDVMRELVEIYPNANLIIVGDGEDSKKLEAKVNDLRLSEHVWFAGNLTKDALGATIKAADIFVLNTAYEGLSHQLIEVMDIGTPIVTTNVGGNPELITDGVNGFMVEFNDAEGLKSAITRVLNHPESRERIVQSARGHSKLFRKEVVVEEIVDLLKQIHARKNPV